MKLFCYNNKLEKIPILNNLQELSCSNNQLIYIPTLSKLKYLKCSHNIINDIIENNISKLNKLNKFIELFYLIKCKKRLRHFYYEKVLKPKIEKKYHPNNLIKLIDETEDYESILDNW